MQFRAQIKQVIIKSLVSLDKEGEIKLRFNAENDTLVNEINKLHKADEEVNIEITNFIE